MNDKTKIALGAGGILAAAILIPKLFKKRETVPAPDQPPPPIPSVFLTIRTDPATNITKTSAQLNGYIESLGNNKIVDILFEVGGLSGKTNEYVVGRRKAIGEVGLIVSKLTPKTQYKYRIIARSTSDAATGDWIYFTANEIPRLTFGILSGAFTPTATQDFINATWVGTYTPRIWFTASNRTKEPIVNRVVKVYFDWAPFSGSTRSEIISLPGITLNPGETMQIDESPNVSFGDMASLYVWAEDTLTREKTNQIKAGLWVELL